MSKKFVSIIILIIISFFGVHVNINEADKYVLPKVEDIEMMQINASKIKASDIGKDRIEYFVNNFSYDKNMRDEKLKKMKEQGKNYKVTQKDKEKELFIAVKNDVGAELNIFQKTNYKRSSYLDAIINKYLS